MFEKSGRARPCGRGCQGLGVGPATASQPVRSISGSRAMPLNSHTAFGLTRPTNGETSNRGSHLPGRLVRSEAGVPGFVAVAVAGSPSFMTTASCSNAGNAAASFTKASRKIPPFEASGERMSSASGLTATRPFSPSSRRSHGACTGAHTNACVLRVWLPTVRRSIASENTCSARFMCRDRGAAISRTNPLIGVVTTATVRQVEKWLHHAAGHRHWIGPEHRRKEVLALTDCPPDAVRQCVTRSAG
jgi:hypothetical protein